jgi:hypothetical protein
VYVKIGIVYSIQKQSKISGFTGIFKCDDLALATTSVMPGADPLSYVESAGKIAPYPVTYPVLIYLDVKQHFFKMGRAEIHLP